MVIIDLVRRTQLDENEIPQLGQFLVAVEKFSIYSYLLTILKYISILKIKTIKRSLRGAENALHPGTLCRLAHHRNIGTLKVDA